MIIWIVLTIIAIALLSRAVWLMFKTKGNTRNKEIYWLLGISFLFNATAWTYATFFVIK